MISAHSSLSNVKRAAMLCDDFIVKPLRKEVLLAKMVELGITGIM